MLKQRQDGNDDPFLRAAPEYVIGHMSKSTIPEITEPDEEDELDLVVMSHASVVQELYNLPVRCILETKSGKKWTRTSSGTLNCDEIHDEQVRVVIRNDSLSKLTDVHVAVTYNNPWENGVRNMGRFFPLAGPMTLDVYDRLRAPTTNPIPSGTHAIRVEWRRGCKKCYPELKLEVVYFLFKKP